MTLADLPRLTVDHVEPDGCTVHYDPSPWIGEGFIAGIHLADDRFAWGRLRSVNAAARTCSFHPDDVADLSELKPGSRYAYIDGYWGERAQLVLGGAARWQRIRFEPADTVRFRTESGGWIAVRSSPNAPSDGEVVPGGWDHEHCGICWRTIGSGGDAEGYRNPRDSWVCEGCFTRFVQTRSLAFIVM